MNTALRAAGTLLLAATLSACQRETNTVVTTPVPGEPAARSSASTSTSTATGEATAAPAAAASTGANVAPMSAADYSEAMKRLDAAGQRLREAIQAMAQQPAGDRRNEAIRQAHAALLDTQRAMISMPPEMRIADNPIGTTSSIAGGSVGNAVYPLSDAEYTKAMEKLQRAAQQLRESIQRMADEPVSERRDKAIKAAHQALFDTKQAMIQLPPELRTEKK